MARKKKRRFAVEMKNSRQSTEKHASKYKCMYIKTGENKRMEIVYTYIYTYIDI